MSNNASGLAAHSLPLFPASLKIYKHTYMWPSQSERGGERGVSGVSFVPSSIPFLLCHPRCLPASHVWWRGGGLAPPHQPAGVWLWWLLCSLHLPCVLLTVPGSSSGDTGSGACEVRPLTFSIEQDYFTGWWRLGAMGWTWGVIRRQEGILRLSCTL